MNKIIKQLVAFAKIQSAIVSEISYPDGCNMRDAIKTDLFNWFQDNIEEIKKLNEPIPVKTQREINFETFPYLTSEELRIGMDHGKLELVKEYKTRTGKSLLDTKWFVEDVFAKYNYQFSNVYRPRNV